MRLLSQLRARPPWLALLGFLAAFVIQLQPAWRSTLLFDRVALQHREYWRAWTGHWVHFGWSHFAADAGLFFVLGCILPRRHPTFTRFAIALMPPFISAAIYFFDPAMQWYAGLSALNLGLLLYLAAQGWQRQWTDWFWPAVLVLYVGEAVFEVVKGGQGGGMIQFDDPSIKVATSAHLASAAYALLAWGIAWGTRQSEQKG